MDPHLPGDLRLLGVNHHEVPLPLAGRLPAAPGALVAVPDRFAVLARLEVDHAALAPSAAFAAGAAAFAAGAAGFGASFFAGRLPDFSSAFLWESTTHSSRPSPGWRIVRPIRLS